MRHSPIKHRVDQYRRASGIVKAHDRGKGSRPTLAPRVVRRRAGKVVDQDTDLGKGKAFTINFTYGKGQGESVVVFADTYAKALDEGYEERIDKHKVPLEIEIVDPLLGTAISLVARGARGLGGLTFRGIKGGARLGAKYAIKGARATPGVLRKIGEIERKAIVAGAKVGKRVAIEGGHVAWTALQKWEAQKLVEKSFSKNKTEAYFAQRTLRRKYPEIADKSSWSRT